MCDEEKEVIELTDEQSAPENENTKEKAEEHKQLEENVVIVPRELKPATTFDEQLNKIKERGCIIGDEEWATEVLKQINYYRLTAYFLPYKEPDETYAEGTTFNNMYSTYEFDRKLRHLLFTTIEEIEIMLRAQLSYHHAHRYGALGYENEENFNNWHNHEKFIKQINEDIDRNKNKLSVKHHKQFYGGKFPIWVVIELFTVGQLSIFYSDMIRADKKAIAKDLYQTTDTNMASWLKCLTELRNNCAHYSRLYNNRLVSIPSTPKDFPYSLGRTIFDYILVLKFLYYDPIKWRKEFIIHLENLIEEYKPSIELNRIGFPDEWKDILKYPNPKLDLQ